MATEATEHASHRRRGRRSFDAFTLVELLVVMAIIGVLLAILVPAVQSARESARRLQCTNNMKQLGLAILSYESMHGTFPAGGWPSPSPAPQSYGHSWIMEILPYCEQGSLYDKFDFAAVHGPSVGLVYSAAVGNTYNGNLVKGLSIPILVCPSSPLSRWTMENMEPLKPAGVQAPNYAAIAGSTNHPSVENRDSNAQATRATGRLSYGGVLIMRRRIAASSVRDGLSNTMIVGEQSDWCIDNSGARQECRSQQWHGFTMGPWNIPGGDNNRFFNGTTVRYQINTKGWNRTGIGVSQSGVANAYGANRPLLSTHVGGVQTLFADGSAHFLADGTDPQILFNLADRNDGNPMPPGW